MVCRVCVMGGGLVSVRSRHDTMDGFRTHTRAVRTCVMLSTAKMPPISRAEARKRSRMWMGKKGPRQDYI